ncbi:uncharacterized protein LOC119634887 [Glossina fuscipes]|uniref:Uncharacterized protein LOC119634887 n=1 Tax=Glossina fuscipes TaxID=7396 RepID=A0A8U0WJV3_9MUSC|nr:uncharacterized protein LOC119634887 [Glossina fuscipes]KAI9584580.1 hypothetical protein GQX74_006475 [Glossina fuscipes]
MRRQFYTKSKFIYSTSFEDLETSSNPEKDEDDYTSSSFDRSSVDSIPWTDDAIKLNSLEWEKIERMLRGVEEVTGDEDLRNEISDWQRKFPHFVSGIREGNLCQLGADATSAESVATLKLISDEEDDYKVKGGQCIQEYSSEAEDLSFTPSPLYGASSEDINILKLFEDFTLNAVPYTQRENIRKPYNNQPAYSKRTPASPAGRNHLRMPPILNVLESTCRFRKLAKNKNQSFVQLTQVNHAQSAIIRQNEEIRGNHTRHSAWHMPLLANRFFSKRNSLILPTISTIQQKEVQQCISKPTTTTDRDGLAFSLNKSSANVKSFTPNFNYHSQSSHTRNHILSRFPIPSSSQSNSSSSLRSASAASQYLKPSFNGLYLPYSAYKFKTFK